MFIKILKVEVTCKTHKKILRSKEKDLQCESSKNLTNT